MGILLTLFEKPNLIIVRGIVSELEKLAKFEFRNRGILVFNTLEYVFNWKKAIITIIHLSLAIEKVSLKKTSRIIVESVTPVLELSTQKSFCKSLSSSLGLLCWHSL